MLFRRGPKMTKTVSALMVCDRSLAGSFVTGLLLSIGDTLKLKDLSAPLRLLWEVPSGEQSAIEFKFSETKWEFVRAIYEPK